MSKDLPRKSKPQQQVQASLRAISAGISDADETAIFRFDQYPYQLTDFINGPDKLLTQLDRIQIATSTDSMMAPDTSTNQTSIPRTTGPPGIPGPISPSMAKSGWALGASPWLKLPDTRKASLPA